MLCVESFKCGRASILGEVAVHVLKVVAIVVSVHLNISKILVVSLFLRAKVSPDWRFHLGFGTWKKCPSPLNRVVPSIEVTNTKIV